MRVVALSDTHAPRHWKRLPDAVARELDGADLVLHAGDVCTASVLDELAQLAPVRVALGNNDGPDVTAWGATETVQLELEGLRVAMVHDSGSKVGRPARVRRLFPDADVLVFGHSHIPWDAAAGGQRLLNPGSPTDKRRQPVGTLMVLEVADGALLEVQLVEIR